MSSQFAVGAGPIQIARWRHAQAELDDCELPSNILVMKRTPGRSWRRLGGREEAASLRPGELGLLCEGGHGSWRFEFGEGAVHDVLHVYLPHQRLRELVGDDRSCGPELCDRLKLRDPVLALLMREVDAALDDPVGLNLYVEGLLTTIAARLMQVCSSGKPVRPARGGLAAWQLKRACEAMEARMDQDFGLDALARIAGCSPAHFSRAFKQSTGLPPFAWLLGRRIERAKSLLSNPDLTLAEIALAVGFSAQPQFTTAFRRMTGATPGAWRKELKA